MEKSLQHDFSTRCTCVTYLIYACLGGVSMYQKGGCQCMNWGCHFTRTPKTVNIPALTYLHRTSPSMNRVGKGTFKMHRIIYILSALLVASSLASVVEQVPLGGGAYFPFRGHLRETRQPKAIRMACAWNISCSGIQQQDICQSISGSRTVVQSNPKIGLGLRHCPIPFARSHPFDTLLHRQHNQSIHRSSHVSTH